MNEQAQDRLWLFAPKASIREHLQVVSQHDNASDINFAVLIARENSLEWTYGASRGRDLVEERVYDVSSLMTPAVDQEMPAMGVLSRTDNTPLVLCGPKGHGGLDIEQIIVHLENNSGPDSSWLQEGIGIEFRRGTELFVYQLPSVHRRVAAALDDLRQHSATWQMRVRVVPLDADDPLLPGPLAGQSLPQAKTYDLSLHGVTGAWVAQSSLEQRRYPGNATVDEAGTITTQQEVLRSGLSFQARLQPFPGGYTLDYVAQQVSDLGNRQVEHPQTVPHLGSWLSSGSLVLPPEPFQELVLAIQQAEDGKRFALIAEIIAPEIRVFPQAVPLPTDDQQDPLSLLLAGAHNTAQSLRISSEAWEQLQELSITAQADWDQLSILLARNDIWINDSGDHWFVDTDAKAAQVPFAHSFAGLLSPTTILLHALSGLNPDDSLGRYLYLAIPDSTPPDKGEISDLVEMSFPQFTWEHFHKNINEFAPHLALQAPAFLHRHTQAYLKQLRQGKLRRLHMEMVAMPKDEDLPSILAADEAAALLGRYPLMASSIIASGDRRSLGYLRQHSYLAQYQQTKHGRAPRLGYLNSGVVMDVDALLSTNQENIKVQVRFAESSTPQFTMNHDGTESPRNEHRSSLIQSDMANGAGIVTHGLEHSYLTVITIIDPPGQP